MSLLLLSVPLWPSPLLLFSSQSSTTLLVLTGGEIRFLSLGVMILDAP